jgi:hypothetical protein
MHSIYSKGFLENVTLQELPPDPPFEMDMGVLLKIKKPGDMAQSLETIPKVSRNLTGKCPGALERRYSRRIE